jgi:hypothetical protein
MERMLGFFPIINNSIGFKRPAQPIYLPYESKPMLALQRTLPYPLIADLSDVDTCTPPHR